MQNRDDTIACWRCGSVSVKKINGVVIEPKLGVENEGIGNSNN